MSADDLVFQAQVKQVHDLVHAADLIGKQILYCIDVIVIPFQFQTLRVTLWAPEIYLVFLSEKRAIQQVVNLLVIDLENLKV